MNKKELIEKINAIPWEEGFAVDTLKINRAGLIQLIEQLDEPQKPVVPQFVADWLGKVKNKLFGLNYNGVPSEIYDWVYEEEGNLKKLHIACVIGYTVEKEKRYRVKMKNAYYNKHPQFLCETDNGIFWAAEIDLRKTKFTRKELEQAGFCWVFNCQGVEIEEVE